MTSKFTIYSVFASSDGDFGAHEAEDFGINKIFAHCLENKLDRYENEKLGFYCDINQACTCSTLSDAKVAVSVGVIGKSGTRYEHGLHEGVYFYYHDPEPNKFYDEEDNEVDMVGYDKSKFV
jgi:hypothetical protein